MTQVSIKGAGKSSVPTGIGHITDLKSSKPTLLRLSATRLIDTTKFATCLYTKGGKIWIKDWINGGPTEWGGVWLDSDIVDIDENCINYIHYNPKLVKETEVDELEVENTGTTGHYLTLDSWCDNKKIAVIPIPIRMLDR